MGKTSSTHYTIAYHLIWLAKYHRRALTGEAQKETTRLIGACCEQHGLTLLAMETEEDHMQVFVSAPPRFSPAMIANLLKGIHRATCGNGSRISKKGVERSMYGRRVI